MLCCIALMMSIGELMLMLSRSPAGGSRYTTPNAMPEKRCISSILKFKYTLLRFCGGRGMEVVVYEQFDGLHIFFLNHLNRSFVQIHVEQCATICVHHYILHPPFSTISHFSRLHQDRVELTPPGTHIRRHLYISFTRNIIE